MRFENFAERMDHGEGVTWPEDVRGSKKRKEAGRILYPHNKVTRVKETSFILCGIN